MGLFDFLGGTSYGADAGIPGMMTYDQPPTSPFAVPGMGTAEAFMGGGQSAMGALSPEVLAKNFAARGVPPPPVDLQPQPANVGAALTWNTVPLPTPRPAGAMGAPLDITSQAQRDSMAAGPMGTPAQGGDKLAETLKGLRAPANPELQKISTPSAPRPTSAIKGGDIIALLQSLQQGRPAGLDLPATLGAALRR